MERLDIVRRQLCLDCTNDIRALFGGIAIRIGVRFTIPYLFIICGIDMSLLRSFKQITIAAGALLHVETVETEIFALCSRFVVITHPINQIFHFIGTIDDKAGLGKNLCRRAVSAMNVAVDRLTAAAVALQRKGTHTVFFYQYLKYVKPQLLKFLIAVGCFTKGNDLCLIWDGNFRNGVCIF